jgi:two-component system OmpR family sensor kinase
MARRFGGLRLRLALSISAVSLAVVAGSFVALRESTAVDLRHRIDRELREQAAEFDQQASAGVRTPAQLRARSERFLRSQRYHAKSRIFLIEVRGGPPVTNQQEVVERDIENERGRDSGHERSEAGRLMSAPPGLSNASMPETGGLRVLTEPVVREGHELGTFRVADPLRAVEEARSGLTSAFLAVGIAALIVSLAVAAWVATLVTRPLRRMAGVASAVDSGELDHRIGHVGARDEVGVLADAFDHMLDRLERAFRRQEEFVSDASHELRTPLTVLRGQVELLGPASDPEERRRTIETVLRELDHMNRLVDDMLTLAGVESERLVRPERIDLEDFLEDLRRDLPLLGDRDYRVEGVSAGVLHADPERLNQVLRNLVRNAAAHTRPGDSITVTATARGPRLEFAVADHGPGIPADELERVFDRFHRATSERYGHPSGTGLGLAIARAIVEAHGGRIWAESEAGAGATLRFELPGFGTTPRAEPPGPARRR